MIRALMIASFVTLAPAAPLSAACVAGAKCLTVPRTMRAETLVAGDRLPAGKYEVLVNSRYYGLPPVEDGTWYYKVDRRVYRARPDTLVIVEDVTHLTNRAF